MPPSKRKPANMESVEEEQNGKSAKTTKKTAKKTSNQLADNSVGSAATSVSSTRASRSATAAAAVVSKKTNIAKRSKTTSEKTGPSVPPAQLIPSTSSSVGKRKLLRKAKVAKYTPDEQTSDSDDSDNESDDDDDDDDDMQAFAGQFQLLADGPFASSAKKLKIPKPGSLSAWTAKKMSAMPGQALPPLGLPSPFGVGLPPGMAMASMSNYGSWDPRRSSDWDNSQPLPMCKKRLQHELAQALSEEELLSIYIQPNEDDITKLYALIVGPKDTPYEGGFFQFFLRAGPEYPMKPPRVAILTTSSGRVRFGPNLYAEGKVCLSILGTWTGPAWTAAMTISVILTSIQSLMSVGALRNEPGHEKQQLTDPSIIAYDVNVRHETIRVAVLDNLEQALSQKEPARPGETFWPEKFKHAIYKSFHNSYNDLLSYCEIGLQNQADQPSSKVPKSAQMMQDAIYGYPVGAIGGRHNWLDLKERLIAMKKRVPRVPDVIEVID